MGDLLQWLRTLRQSLATVLLRPVSTGFKHELTKRKRKGDPFRSQRPSELPRRTVERFLGEQDDRAGKPTELSVHHVQSTAASSACPSKRYERVLELLDTERSYVNILNVMLDILRRIPTDPSSPDCVILYQEAADEINETFYKLPQLRDVHACIVRELEIAVENWKEDTSVGAIFVKYSPFLEDYVPFVNAYERIKGFLMSWENNCQKFQEYLRMCQRLPACGRQHLNELLIRPIQRVPSVVNLLKDIRSKTDVTNPDCEELEKAICEIERVLQFINDQKREAEIQNLISQIQDRFDEPRATYRTFIDRLDCEEFQDDQFVQKGAKLALLLFEEFLEVCGIDSNQILHHIDFIPITLIKEITDITGLKNTDTFRLLLTSEDHRIFLYEFSATESYRATKSLFLRKLAGAADSKNPAPLNQTRLKLMSAEEANIQPTRRRLSRSRSNHVLRRLTSVMGSKLKRAISEHGLDYTDGNEKPFSAEMRYSHIQRSYQYLRVDPYLGK